MRVYKQYFKERKWRVVTPSVFKRILHRLTFGRFGETIGVELEEKDIVMLSSGAPQSDANLFDKAALPKHINCRSAQAPVIKV